MSTILFISWMYDLLTHLITHHTDILYSTSVVL